MEKQKKLISLTKRQWEMLDAIKNRDGVDSNSTSIGYLVLEETKRRGIEILPVNKEIKR